MAGLLALYAGELDHLMCDAGDRLSAIRQLRYESADDAEHFIDFVTDDFRDRVRAVLVRRLEELRPILSAHPDQWPSVVWNHWRRLTPEVFAAAAVALDGGIPAPSFMLVADGASVPESEIVGRLATVQAMGWWSLVTYWSRLPGRDGGFERDLSCYVDAPPVLWGALAVYEHLADHSDMSPLDVDGFCAEAVRATLRARAGDHTRSDPVWALSWLRLEYSCQMGDENAARLAPVRVSHDRARRTIDPGAARMAAEQLLERLLDDAGRGNADVTAVKKAMFAAIAALDRPALSLHVVHNTRVEVPVEELADALLAMPTPDDDGGLLLLLNWATPLLEQRRIDDLFKVVDHLIAVRHTAPLSRAGIDRWVCARLLEAGLPAVVLHRIGTKPAAWELALPDHLVANRILDRAYAARDLGDVALAVELMNEAEPLAEKDDWAAIRLTVLQAGMLAEAGAPDESIRMLHHVFQPHPDPPIALLLGLGQALSRLGMHLDAARHYRLALQRGIGAGDWQTPLYAALTFSAEAAAGFTSLDEHAALLAEVDPKIHPEAGLAELTARLRLGDDGPRTAQLISVLPFLAGQAAEDGHVGRYRRAVRLAAKTSTGEQAVQWWTSLVDLAAERGGSPGADSVLYLAAVAYRHKEWEEGRFWLAAAIEAMVFDIGGAVDYAANVASAHELQQPLQDVCQAVIDNADQASAADLRLAAEAGRDVVGRSMWYAKTGPRRVFTHGLDDTDIRRMLNTVEPVAVLEFLTAGRRVLPLLSVPDGSGVRLTRIELPALDLQRLGRRLHYRLDSWTPQRPGNPFDMTEWQTVRDGLMTALDPVLADDHHVVVLPGDTLARVPWHAALQDRWTCSYMPGWAALQAVLQRPAAERAGAEGIAVVPRAGDPPTVLAAMNALVTQIRAQQPAPLLLEGTACDSAAVRAMFESVATAYLLCHGYVDAAAAEVALMLAADGSLPLAHSVAADHPVGRRHRLSWHELTLLSRAPELVISAACSSGMSHPVGAGGQAGFFGALRQAGLRTLVAPAWNIVAADVLPMIAALRLHHRAGSGLARSMRLAAQEAVTRGVPAWSAYSLTVEGDWR